MLKIPLDSKAAFSNLVDAANSVLECAKDTQHGVGVSCFVSWQAQEYAFSRASAKVKSAQQLVDAVAVFGREHGDFN